MLSVVQPLLEGVLYLFTPLFGRQHVLHCTVFLFAEGPRLHWSHFGSSHFGSRHLVPLCWCLCPDRDSDDLPLLSYCFVVLTAAVSSISSIQWEPMTVREENDGKCRKRGDAWQDRYGWTIDGRKEWYSRFCSEKNVCTVGVGWTRSQKLQSLQDNKKQCRKEWYCRFCSEKNVCTVGVGRTRSQKLQSLQNNKKQCQKNLSEWG